MSQKLDGFIHKLPASEQELLAKENALEDIESDEDNGLQVRCHFGAAIVVRPKTDEAMLVNILLPESDSYEEAVGASYLEMKEDYPPEDGWVIAQLSIEEEVVWVDSSYFDES